MAKATTGATSIRELAGAVGRSHVAVLGWLKDDRWPFARTPPWNAATVVKVKAWAAETLAANPGAAAEPPAAHPAAGDATPQGQGGQSIERQVKIKGMLERAKLTEAQRKKLEGDLIPRDEVERGRVERIHAVKTAFMALPDTGVVETMLSGMTVQEAKDLLRGRVTEICHKFASG